MCTESQRRCRTLYRYYSPFFVYRTFLTDKYKCYLAEAPQEFDEKGKELGPDAQVWKTYVREADQVDEELVDGWNKSMDVILIFAALFSAISTAFVIESYKSLKQDPADVSSQTLLTISQTLVFIANGSQPLNALPNSETGVPAFEASAKDICVNVLWFLSLSLSVAVSLISMLAKEWCLEYMAGRTGPAGAQARRRQQRWDGLVNWRMRELIMLLPSLIHMSLLLFAIGLCVFLWDVHYGVAIPVAIVTAFAAGAYLACTVVPFLYDYCPYGTVLSRLAKQFMNIRSQSFRNNVIQDQVTANALKWMIMHCETPRSINIALQSLAAADENLPITVLEECHAWAMIKQRMECGDDSEQSEQYQKTTELYARALELYPVQRRKIDILQYGLHDDLQREEQLVLGIQATIRSLIDEWRLRTNPKDLETTKTLNQCDVIGLQYLSRALEDGHAAEIYNRLIDPAGLAEKLVSRLEQYLKGKVLFDLDMYRILSASLAFLLCCNAAWLDTDESVNMKHVLRLIRGYSSGLERNSSKLLQQTIPPNLVIVTLWILMSCPNIEEHQTYEPREKALESLWTTLMTAAYSDNSVLKHLDTTFLAHGMLYLLANIYVYELSPEDCKTIKTVLDQILLNTGLPTTIKSAFHAYYIHCLSHNLTAAGNCDAIAPQVFRTVNSLQSYSPWDDNYLLPGSQVYILAAKYPCMTDDDDTSLASWDAGTILAYSPIPRCSPQLVQALSSSNLITHLSNAMGSQNPSTQVFAKAQLWIFIHMSMCEADRTSPALTALEAELLKCPALKNNPERQEVVAETLETELLTNIDKVSHHLEDYVYRILEIMLKRRFTPLPQAADSALRPISKRLRGVESFVDYETKIPVADPNQCRSSSRIKSAKRIPGFRSAPYAGEFLELFRGLEVVN
ncbi:unnamed protein product [Rhizoctonia solani]|uniref:DUF6535 domain-containing protein n=1 Tax=Rhizoctonia solani TaxID=456999 RepID=A0A8H3HLR6_9AGAM|nr:unnamed protein product [Rhizoctonia solani]